MTYCGTDKKHTHTHTFTFIVVAIETTSGKTKGFGVCIRTLFELRGILGFSPCQAERSQVTINKVSDSKGVMFAVWQSVCSLKTMVS